jgi:hypothetical protein
MESLSLSINSMPNISTAHANNVLVVDMANSLVHFASASCKKIVRMMSPNCKPTKRIARCRKFRLLKLLTTPS